MENTTNYNQQQYYYPPMQLRQEKKPLPAFVGPLVMFFVALITALPSLITRIINYLTFPDYFTFPEMYEEYQQYLIHTNLSTLLFYLFGLLTAGVAGFLCYRGVRGSLKFSACLEIGFLLKSILSNILYALLYLTDSVESLSTVAEIIINNIALPIFGGIFSVITLIIINSLEKKADKKIKPATVGYDQYGNPVMPKKKQGFTVGKAAIVVFGTDLLYFLFALIQGLIFGFTMVNIDSSLYYTITYFFYAANNLLTIAFVSALAFPLGKGVKNGISYIGCYGLAAFISGILSSFINILILFIVGIKSMESAGYTIATGITSVLGNIIGIIAIIGISALIRKRKEFSEN